MKNVPQLNLRLCLKESKKNEKLIDFRAKVSKTQSRLAKMLVILVKVKMVIFIFGLCHLLTIYKY